jgi:RecG-like helicase
MRKIWAKKFAKKFLKMKKFSGKNLENQNLAEKNSGENLSLFAHLENAEKFLPAKKIKNPLEIFDSKIGKIAFLAGATTAKNKKILKEKLAAGEISVLIGTHAILTPDTIFANLALAVIDEQHRFGVEQRAVLEKNFCHTIAMTATPIPRSLALTIYGDKRFQ